MPGALPASVKYLIVGAGVHGLSTAYHLAKLVRRRGGSPSEEILLIDKTGVAAGASGIACGVVRNNYFQPAMSDLMVESISLWEEHAQALNYQSVGYLATAGPRQAGDLKQISQRHAAAGFPHAFVEGQRECNEYMRGLFSDWKEMDTTAVLHEQRGGYAYSREAIHGLAKLAQAEGVPIVSEVEVTGFEINSSDDTVRSVQTSAGTIEADMVVVAPGPWIGQCWSLLQLPNLIDVRDGAGMLHPNRDMWTYWQLQEGEVGMWKESYALANGKTPPVMHIDSEEPLFDEQGGRVTSGQWGIYFKRHHDSVQGGSVPIELGVEAKVDPYGPESPYYTVDEEFIRYWTAGLARTLKRFEGCRVDYCHAPSGGIGCFSVDNFPVFDFMRPNVYVIADSNHGFKMLGVGKEVADILTGRQSRILRPFRFSRFVEGELHPVSNSPFPWS